MLDENISLFDAIRALTGHKNRISIEKLYCRAMGNDLAGGAFLSTLIFWCDKNSAASGGWFYHSAQQWQDEMFLSDYLVRKYTRFCQEAGWLETRLMKVNGAPTTHYRINRRKFSEWILEFLNIDSGKFQNPGFSNFTESYLKEAVVNSVKKGSSAPPDLGPSIPAPWQQNGGREATYAHFNARCEPKTRLKLVNALIDIHGLSAYIDADHPDADRKLREMHELACTLHEMHIGPKDIAHFYKLWQERDFRGQKNQRPQGNQFFAFISQQLADTTNFPPEDPGLPPTIIVTDTWEA